MADEFEQDHNYDYSSFWPLLILVVGLLVWFGYQDYTLNKQRNFYKGQFDAASSTLEAAKSWQDRYSALMKDLNDTSAKSPDAAAILKDAVQAGVQAGLIHFKPNATNSADTPAAPTPSK